MENQAYISHVHLKGYKSIRDMEVDLLPGLNIIIGPNGSGKTNFLEFVKKGLEREFWELNGNFSFDFEFANCTVHKWQVKSVFKRRTKESFIEESSLQDSGSSNQKLPYPENGNAQSSNYYFVPLLSYEEINNILRPFIKINYSTPANIPLLDTPYSTESNKMFQFPQFFTFAYFIDTHLGNIGNSLHGSIEKYIPGFFIFDKDVLNSLKAYSPIKDIRLAQGFRYHFDHSDVYLDFLSFEFFVNDTWLSWKQLSDGTKRLFYLIHEVAYFKKGVFLVEEPELGIHPDQLYKLMDFLKEQSKEKQIIITTHSPEVLNILGKDELDRIIITRYDDEKGTQMHHLSPKQIRKGQIYIEEVGNLKSFWVHSNLEEYEAE